jgi:hypothetical protein
MENKLKHDENVGAESSVEIENSNKNLGEKINK